MNDFKNILVIKWGALGDLVAATTALRILREQYPAGRITVLSNSLMNQICPAGSLVDEVLNFDEENISWWNWVPTHIGLVRQLRRKNFDVAINLRWVSERSAFLAWLSGAPIRVGSGPKESRFLYNVRAPLIEGRRHEFRRHLDIVEALGIHPSKIVPYVFCSKEDLAFAEKFFKENSLKKATTVGLHPGASKLSKAWPAERYAELAGRLAGNGAVRVLTTWGPGEEELAHRVASAAARLGAVAPRTDTPGKLASLIKSCGVFVCNYSGPMNVAMAVETPLVALGSTSAEDWGPFGELHRTINKAKPKDSYTEEEQLAVMKEISVEEVFRLVRQRLYELYRTF